MIDSDGNGMLSWEEVYDLCLASLNIFSTGTNEDFIEDMAKYFSDFIFKVSNDINTFVVGWVRCGR